MLIYPTPCKARARPMRSHARWQLADRRAECDVLILTRGGGSLEDLWSFNEESRRARDRRVELPIIIGVGHEIDFTIADFVADLRAPTPSQAAELAVPDQREWLKRFARLEQQIAQCTRQHLAKERRHLATSRTGCALPPGHAAARARQRLDELEARAPPRSRAPDRDAQAAPRSPCQSVAHARPAHRS